MIVMHADHRYIGILGLCLFLSGRFFSRCLCKGSALNSSLACTFLSCDYIVAHISGFCNTQSAQSSQENFVERAESCDKCCFSWKNLFTNKKECDIIKMLWCPHLRTPFLFGYRAISPGGSSLAEQNPKFSKKSPLSKRLVYVIMSIAYIKAHLTIIKRRLL